MPHLPLKPSGLLKQNRYLKRKPDEEERDYTLIKVDQRDKPRDSQVHTEHRPEDGKHKQKGVFEPIESDQMQLFQHAS